MELAHACKSVSSAVSDAFMSRLCQTYMKVSMLTLKYEWVSQMRKKPQKNGCFLISHRIHLRGRLVWITR